MFIQETITILNSVVCDAESKVETALTLTDEQRKWLRDCMLNGRIGLRVLASDKAASPDATIDSISGSIDGTNYRVLQSWTGVSINNNGELALPEITAFIHPAITKLRLDATVVSLTGTNKITLLAQLRLEA